MNKNVIEGNWEQVKGKIQQQWGKLTNDEIEEAKGDAKILAGKIQEKYGKTQEQAQKEVDEWNKKNAA